MAYSTLLEQLIDNHQAENTLLVKKKMFGGVGYLLNGNMCFGIYKDFLVLRTTEENANKLLQKAGFLPFDITGRTMTGWIMVEPHIYKDAEMLAELLDEGVRFAGSLPSK